jgi:hypothetical protein
MPTKVKLTDEIRDFLKEWDMDDGHMDIHETVLPAFDNLLRRALRDIEDLEEYSRNEAK